jgi:hypothetical protein
VPASEKRMPTRPGIFDDYHTVAFRQARNTQSQMRRIGQIVTAAPPPLPPAPPLPVLDYRPPPDPEAERLAHVEALRRRLHKLFDVIFFS